MTTLRFDPTTYPGRRPAGPVLVYRGDVVPLRLDDPLPAPFRVDGVAAGAPILEAQHELRWSVAYGSNASPDRLVDKRLDLDGALLLPATLTGWVPAFEARHTRYGAVPLTLVPHPGAVIDTWMLGLPPHQLDELDRTEGRVAGDAALDVDPAVLPSPGEARYPPPGTYRLGHVGDVAVADRFVVRAALAYLPGPGTVVQHTGELWRSWPEHDQTMAADALADPGAIAAARAAPLAEPLLGPWPHTRLAELPLFVYGSLQPGGSAWGRIAGLVESLGDATVSGRLWDTGQGWPALVTGPAAAVGTVHGTLLQARDGASAAELLALTDVHEGVPDLFRRVAVPLVAAGGRARSDDGGERDVWATAYVWGAGHPPGAPIPGGRWSSP